MIRFVWPKYWVLLLTSWQSAFYLVDILLWQFLDTVYVCVHVWVSVYSRVFVVELYFLVNMKTAMTGLCGANRGQSEASVNIAVCSHCSSLLPAFQNWACNFYRFGLKRYVRGLLWQGFYTCYERKKAFQSLGFPGWTENLHSGADCASQEGAVMDSFFFLFFFTA